jgi:hypothetical protein
VFNVVEVGLCIIQSRKLSLALRKHFTAKNCDTSSGVNDALLAISTSMKFLEELILGYKLEKQLSICSKPEKSAPSNA